MTTHDLKIWPEPFAALLDGTKRHEVHKNDRAFAVGDVLHLREWQPPRWSAPGPADGPSHPGGYTGRTADFRVTYITPGGSHELTADLCVMSVEPVRAPTPAAPLDLVEAHRAGSCACGALLRLSLDAEARDSLEAIVCTHLPAALAEVETWRKDAADGVEAMIQRWRTVGAKPFCAHCGEEYPVADGEMARHVAACPKNPLVAALAAKDERIAALRLVLLSEADRVAALHAVSPQFRREHFQREHCIESARRLRALAGEG